MNFTREQKIDIILIIISIISIISSFILSLDYISWIAVILCGIPIFKECIEGLIREFDIKADLLVTIAIIASIIILPVTKLFCIAVSKRSTDSRLFSDAT